MLVRARSLTLVIVALLLVTLHTVVTSAKAAGSVQTTSEDFDLHATKRSSQKVTNSQSKQASDNSLSADKQTKVSNVDSGFGDTSFMMNDAAVVSAQNWTGQIVDGNNHGGKKEKKKKDRRTPTFWKEDIQVGCKELRAKRYISDGFCTSEKPINEVVCTGNCLPLMDMPWYAEFIKTVARTKLKDWQCVEDIIRKKRVKLLCQDGTLRAYRIKVVKSCKCKKITDKHNRTSNKNNKKRRRRRRRRRKDRNNKSSKGS